MQAALGRRPWSHTHLPIHKHNPSQHPRKLRVVPCPVTVFERLLPRKTETSSTRAGVGHVGVAFCVPRQSSPNTRPKCRLLSFARIFFTSLTARRPFCQAKPSTLCQGDTPGVYGLRRPMWRFRGWLFRAAPARHAASPSAGACVSRASTASSERDATHAPSTAPNSQGCNAQRRGRETRRGVARRLARCGRPGIRHGGRRASGRRAPLALFATAAA
mmetsp:Transcript_52318/g.120277  ORF Transcript_52318/g.120277 Transcript_52318/m.120277 type:complete len:217 (+) Transcript_52318:24-674(+)